MCVHSKFEQDSKQNYTGGYGQYILINKFSIDIHFISFIYEIITLTIPTVEKTVNSNVCHCQLPA